LHMGERCAGTSKTSGEKWDPVEKGMHMRVVESVKLGERKPELKSA